METADGISLANLLVSVFGATGGDSAPCWSSPSMVNPVENDKVVFASVLACADAIRLILTHVRVADPDRHNAIIKVLEATSRNEPPEEFSPEMHTAYQSIMERITRSVPDTR